MNLNDPVTICHPRFGRIPAKVTKIDTQVQTFVVEDLTGLFFHRGGTIQDWLCFPEDVGLFVHLGHEALDYSIQPPKV